MGELNHEFYRFFNQKQGGNPVQFGATYLFGVHFRFCRYSGFHTRWDFTVQAQKSG
jgi:hypothetical protein